MKIPFVECMMCHEQIAVALMEHRVPVCVDCANDVGARLRVQARCDQMYEAITSAIAGLCTCTGDASCVCVDAERYHQVYMARMELRAPIPSSASPAEIQQAVQRKDKLNKQLLNTRKKNDRISEILRMHDDLATQINLLQTLELAQIMIGEVEHA